MVFARLAACAPGAKASSADHVSTVNLPAMNSGEGASFAAVSPAVAKSNDWPLLESAKHNMISGEAYCESEAAAAAALAPGAAGELSARVPILQSLNFGAD